jgi:hypothetical protein
VANTVKITSKGREMIVARLKGATPAQAEFNIIGWGSGAPSGAAAVTDVGLFKEESEARVTGTSTINVTTSSVNDTYQVVGTITAAGAKTITECGLSDSATKPASTTVGTAQATGSTTLVVASNTGFSGLTPPFDIQVENEVQTVTAGQAGTSWTVTRGVNGSVDPGVNHPIGAAVTLGNAPGQTQVNANLPLHASFSGLPLSTGDSISLTIQVQVSSS